MINTTANKITLARIALIPVFLVLLYCGKTVPAFILYIIACCTDWVDGYVARRYNQISDFGKFVDPLADKILVLAAVCFFVENGQMPGWAAFIVLFREFAVSGMRLVAAGKGKVIAAAFSGKIKTFSTMIALGAMLLFPMQTVLNAVCIAVILLTTLYSGIEYFYINRSVFQD